MLLDGDYKIITNDGDKTFKVEAHGMMDEAGYAKFMNDFKAAVAKVNVNEYTLLLDSSDFPVQTQDALGMIGELFKFYKSQNFAKIIIKKGNNVVQGMQIRRMLKEQGMSDITVE